MATEADVQLRAMFDELRPERVELRERALFCGPPGMSDSTEDAILDAAAHAVRAALTPFYGEAMTMLGLMLRSHVGDGGDEWGDTLARILDVAHAMQMERMNAELDRLKAEVAAEGPDASAD